jgi:hypothetical protein
VTVVALPFPRDLITKLFFFSHPPGSLLTIVFSWVSILIFFFLFLFVQSGKAVYNVVHEQA